MDQSGINQYLYRQYARSTKGKQVFGEISGRRFSRQSVISALQGKKLLAPMCFEGTCNTDLFNVWLKQELIPHLTQGQVLILDNAAFHKSKTSRKLIEECGCKILFLPPYSPDLNPIEKYWANRKTKVRYLARERSINENSIGLLKRFKILSDRYRNRRKRFCLRCNLIAGIYNWEL